jgi:hypothetical protein
VCVRVTDVRGVDLRRFDFDFDLTFAALAVHPDGRVYHRYGGRDARGADRWLSEASLRRFLEAGLAQHAEPRDEPLEPAEPGPPLLLERLPSFARRDRGECIHCHSVNTSLYEEHLGSEGGVPRDWIWRSPDPGRVGLDLDRDRQTLVTSVAEGSAAGRAGLRPGDELVQLDGVRLATASDLMHALDRAPAGACRLTVRARRGGEALEMQLELAAGWKVGTPLDMAWRPLKWALTPAPGFGGRPLSRDEQRALGLPEGFAFRVDYLVTWGDTRRFGRAAAAAGLALGDVVVAVDGRRDFESIDHLHAWWRLEVEVGSVVELETLRDGEVRRLQLEVVR